MLENIITITVLCAFVILVRAIFKKKVSARLVYALWLVVILKLFIPVDLISLEVPLPEMPKTRAFSAFEQMGEAIGEADEGIKGSAATFTESFYHASAPLQSAPVGNEAQGNAEPIPPVTAPAPSVTDDKAKEAEPLISLSGLEIILAVWAAGCGVTLLIFSSLGLRTAVRLRKSRRYHSTAGRTKVYVSPRISSPCVTGIVPAIYITPEAERCPDLHLILLHERTHIRHGDHIWAILRILCIALLWWNPLVWAAALLSKRDAELACDESVAKRMTPKERLCYTRLIIDMIPQKSAFAVAFSNGPIKYRIKRLTGRHKNRLLAAIVATVLIIGSGMLTFISVSAIADENDSIIEATDPTPESKDDKQAKDHVELPDDTTAASHDHIFEPATCNEASVCTCGETSGEPLGHLWQNSTDICERCGATKDEPASQPMKDSAADNTADTDDSSIGDKHEHSFAPATCHSPATCTICKATKGSSLGHDYTPATCLSPATCTRCYATNGSPLGHSFHLEACTVCGAENSALAEKYQTAFNIYQNAICGLGISETGFTQKLMQSGFSDAEIAYVTEKLKIDWFKEAERAASRYITWNHWYTQDDLYNHLISLGFDKATATEVTKDYKGNPSPYSASLVHKNKDKTPVSGEDPNAPISWYTP